MRKERHGDVVVDRCRCGGLWCDGRELDAYEERLGHSATLRLERAPRTPRNGPPLRCPRCEADTLLPVSAHGLAFATCERCHGHSLTAPQLAAFEQTLARRSSGGSGSILVDVVASVLEVLFRGPWP